MALRIRKVNNDRQRLLTSKRIRNGFVSWLTLVSVSTTIVLGTRLSETVS